MVEGGQCVDEGKTEEFCLSQAALRIRYALSTHIQGWNDVSTTEMMVVIIYWKQNSVTFCWRNNPSLCDDDVPSELFQTHFSGLWEETGDLYAAVLIEKWICTVKSFITEHSRPREADDYSSGQEVTSSGTARLMTVLIQPHKYYFKILQSAPLCFIQVVLLKLLPTSSH